MESGDQFFNYRMFERGEVSAEPSIAADAANRYLRWGVTSVNVMGSAGSLKQMLSLFESE